MKTFFHKMKVKICHLELNFDISVLARHNVVERVHTLQVHWIFHIFLVARLCCLGDFHFLRCGLSCPKCQSDALDIIPAEVRLYRNRCRTLSHPPMNPPPDILVCLDCGWAEFSIPRSWLAAGWSRAGHAQSSPSLDAVSAAYATLAT